jgi:hypothetical protein
MFVHFIFNKRIDLFDFLFLFSFNLENAKDWFCVSPLLLHKMGKKPSALCNFYNHEEDSILHYLWGCPVAKKFWTSFNIWLSSALDLEVFELTPKETVLGVFFR